MVVIVELKTDKNHTSVLTWAQMIGTWRILCYCVILYFVVQRFHMRLKETKERIKKKLV